MKFENVIGHAAIKSRLIRTVRESRISHAQMFLGPPGTGKLAMAVAYAQFINCKDKQAGDSCGVCPSCVKFEKLAHPDLHFLYPTAKTEKIEKPVSLNFIREWRELMETKKQYFTLPDWYEKIGIERKQAIINAKDCNNLIQTLSYKNYEADYKVMIIWMVEKLFHSAAPKILKMLEEPPDKTLFILVAEDTEPILPTILSRTQIVKFPPIDSESLLDHLIDKGVNPQLANDAIRIYPGDYIQALAAIESQGEVSMNFELFQAWMRLCYAGKMEELIPFIARLVKNTRETQKSLLTYGLRMIRESFLVNTGNAELIRLNKRELEWVELFSKFVNVRNIEAFNRELNESIGHVERNVNSSVLFLDMSLKFIAYLRI